MPDDMDNIVLVEGDALVRGLTARVLGQAGYRVLAVETAGEAFRLALETEAVHLLMADLHLPEGGPGLARRLARLHPDLQTIFLSAYPPEVVCPAEVLRGTWDLLVKPFRPEDLLRVVRRARSRGTPIRP